MTTDETLGFAPEDELPVRYIDRTHAWYGALGYGNPYRYAQFTEVPFTPLGTTLNAARVSLFTTAAPFRPGKGDQSVRGPYNASAKFYEIYSGNTSQDHDLRVSHVGVQRAHLEEDSNCWFPLPALRRAAARRRIGALTARFHGIPTNRSQRHTMFVDCPQALTRCREDGADAAVLVANCPICHQTLSLVARHLEANGVPTVLIGAAKDIVETCGVPRFVFSDFPLGSAAARPFDPASQDSTMELALRMLEGAPAPRSTVQNPLRWNGSPEWRRDYLNLSVLTPADIERARRVNDMNKSAARRIREATLEPKD